MADLPDLSRAVGQLYALFADSSLPERTTFCTHCVLPDEVAVTRTKPLRELTEADLNPYAWSAMSTWGGIEEFRYFLPRLLELLVREELDSTHAWLLWNKITCHGRDWPQQEQSALRDLLDAWWRTILRAPSTVDVDTMLEIINTFDVDLDPYLTLWEQADSEHACRTLANLIVCVPNLYSQRDVILENWLGRPAVGELLIQALQAATTSEDVATFTDALEAHEYWRTTPQP